MSTIHGIGVSPGRIIGQVRRMADPIDAPQDPGAQELASPGYVEEATARLTEAGRAVAAGLRARAGQAHGAGAEVLSATALMATDSMLHKTAGKALAAGRGLEPAIWEAAETVAAMLTSLGGYMAERAADVLDVRSRLIAELRGVPAPGIPDSGSPFILLARDLAPADTATLDPAQVTALVTSEGGPQSHTAILARALGLPAIVAAVGAESIVEGTDIYVDGAAGTVCTCPGTEEQAAALAFAARGPLEVFNGHGTTADGHPVPLLANVGGGSDAVAAAAAGAEGVGLLRTEFCFLGRDAEPGHDEQVAAYGAVFVEFPGRKVVVRTLDAGADKPLPFLTDATEPNPALGVRGFRTDAGTPGVLARQLAAIAAAAAAHQAQVKVMAPMISTAQEATDFAALCAVAGLPDPGVMVEVPSAAVRAASVLRPVAFASIGTNDLTQYTLAADRQFAPLAALNDPWQPAVLELIRLTVAGAEAAGDSSAPLRPVGVCGEAAADPALAVVLVGLGVASLSMTARALAPVAAVLRTVTHAQAVSLAALAVEAEGPAQARAAVRAALPVLDELGL
ncbi:MAG: phosphoenolpyruvate--protein phosphotransferase [Micrococcaceae bacterium]|nr:phosphoenolpyruvate--protein phosphotransferase [Micrococcaceae bacterium]